MDALSKRIPVLLIVFVTESSSGFSSADVVAPIMMSLKFGLRYLCSREKLHGLSSYNLSIRLPAPSWAL
jgi:hypothetical protein